ncbi:hypothetical protein CQW23_24103 [Capsicum baccatum]|uniref:GRF-type domain-containing protein n=1 Tax=Capsicum baccatum TaxID=33114 RepID=A0A2G2VTX7_CAPBA|nr:hypothetical protein CQW23_24103 [Capsicum baccatum]
MSSAVESMRQEMQLDMKRKLQEERKQMAANLKRDMDQDLQKKLEEEREHMKGEVEKIFQEKMVALMAGMQQSSQTFKSSYIYLCDNPAVLKTSRTDRNPDKKFYSCAVGKNNGGCSYFKWIPSDFEVSKLQGIAKFEMLKKLRDSKENRDLLMTLYRE